MIRLHYGLNGHDSELTFRLSRLEAKLTSYN